MLLALALTACSSGGAQNAKPVQPPPMPERTAAEAQDLRLMLAEVAAARACKRLKGTFRPLASGQDGAIVGTLWIEDCRNSQTGTRVSLELSGRGWLWVSREQEKAGATFAVTEYARFEASVSVQGTMDAAYSPREHVATVWFTPQDAPKATFQPIGDIDVETDGVWSSVVSGLASAFASSPEQRALNQLASKGRQRLQGRFAEGIAATVDLCTGRVATGLGHPPQGEMLDAGAGDAPMEAMLHPKGLILTGPYDPSSGALTFAVETVDTGRVHAQLMCQEQAAALARAFVTGEPLPDVEALASKVIVTRGELQSPGRGCPVVLATRPPAGASAPVRFRVRRPSASPKLDPLATCAPGASDEPEPGQEQPSPGADQPVQQP